MYMCIKIHLKKLNWSYIAHCKYLLTVYISGQGYWPFIDKTLLHIQRICGYNHDQISF